MSFKAFLDIAKHAYVEVAATEFGIPGKKQSTSRIALLSGLTRKEVQRLLDAPAANDKDSEAGERYVRTFREAATPTSSISSGRTFPTSLPPSTTTFSTVRRIPSSRER
jgi:hypothetical protein